MTCIATPEHKNLSSGGYENYNFGWPFHHYYTIHALEYLEIYQFYIFLIPKETPAWGN